MALEMTQEKYRKWETIVMKRDGLTVRIAPGIGGRILSLEWEGEELFFTQPEHQGETFSLVGVEDLRAEKRKMGFRLWGGDKTWIAPQSGWWEGIPPLDLDAGQYTFTVENGRIQMKSPLCRETGVQLERSVELSSGGILHLRQTFKNGSNASIRRGIWDVTQFLRPFDLFVPTTTDRVRGYPDEGESISLKERIVSPGPASGRAGTSILKCREALHYKYGGMLDEGWLFAYRPGRKGPAGPLGHLRTFSVEPGGNYAHNAMFEIYNSPNYDYLEVEIHAPLRNLEPGESDSHDQTWFFASGRGGQSETELLDEMRERAGI